MQIIRVSREQEARVSRPAESQARALREQASGRRTVIEMGARGASESLRLQSEGEASAIEARGRAAAEVRDAIQCQIDLRSWTFHLWLFT